MFVAGVGRVRRRAAPGTSRFATRVEGYVEAWAALGAGGSSRCGTRRGSGATRNSASRAPRGAGRWGRVRGVAGVRAGARSAIVAAGRAARPVLDLTPFFCGSRCYPVVGGALVVRDANHMTGTFSATLGPYVLRALDRLDGDVTASAKVSAFV